MPNPGSVRSGYEARFTGVSGSASKVELSKWASGIRTVLASKESISLPIGTTIALVETAGNLTLWTGTTNLSAALSANDTTYASGYAGLEVNGLEGTMYNFRAGNIDNQPPNTTITGGPTGSVNLKDVSFTFTSTESGSSFECSMDGGSYSACISPKTYLAIGAGTHTFRVRAIDAASNPDPSPAERSFTVTQSPVVATTAPTFVKSTEATLNGTVNPNGLAATYQFEYGTSTAYGSKIPATAKSAGSGTTALQLSEPLAYLTSATTYHFRITASNSAGTAKGGDQTFSTPAGPPSATSAAVTSAEGTQATLNATVNPMGAATTYQFEYGQTTSYGSKLPAAPKAVGSGTALLGVSETAQGLTAGVLYHYRVVATNQFGTTNGVDRTFKVGGAIPDTRIVGGEYSRTALTMTAFDLVSQSGATYECRLDAGAWEECQTRDGYSGLSPGSHHLEARAVGAAGIADPTPAQRDWTVDPLGPIGRPTIEGKPRIGHTLSVSNGTWGGSPPASYSYQWYRCSDGDPGNFGSCSAIPGATQREYLLTQADESKQLVAKVTAIRGSAPIETTTLSRYSLPGVLDLLGSLLGERITYTNCSSSECGIWVSRANGSESVFAVHNSLGTGDQALSPDGTLITYYNISDNCIMVAAAQANATPKKVLCDNPEGNYFFLDPTFAPDGTIVFVDRIRHLIRRINIDGTGLTTLFTWSNFPVFRFPSVSADGTRLAFQSDQGPTGEYKPGTWVSTISGGNAKFIHESEGTIDLSPDGTRVAFAYGEEKPFPEYNQVYVADIATGNLTQVSAGGSHFDGGPSWSADGELLVVDRFKDCCHGEHVGNVLLDADGGSEGSVLPGFSASFRQPSDLDEPAPGTNGLLARYKPVVFYHPDEDYFADAVTGAIGWHENFLYYPTYFKGQRGREEEDRSNVLADNSVDTAEPKLTGEFLGGLAPVSQYEILAIEGDNQEAAEWGHNILGAGNHVYGRENPSSRDGVVWLQYWFFYYYNGSIDAANTDFGTHEGDWEFVQYAYDTDTDQLLRATYNQHDGAQTCLPGVLDYVVTANGRVAPAVYVAAHSHASYFAPGNYNLEILGRFGTDMASAEEGPTELTMTPLLGEPWALWEGHWGDTKGKAEFESSSPAGPGHGDNATEEIDPDRVADDASECTVP
jgi:hypothetical protein